MKEKKDITIRLYKLHDYDLVYLFRVLKFPIKDAMKMALAAYVRNEPLFFKVPVSYIDPKVEEEELKVKVIQLHLKLDYTEDKDIIDFLSNIKKNYRTSFIKNLLRGYLAGPATYVYEDVMQLNDTQSRYHELEENILNVKKLDPMKKRKRRKEHIILTQKQKELFDLTGALDGMEVIISDRNKS
jgi:hypothetical protein